METIRERLLAEGAAMVGFADTTGLPADVRGGLDRAIAFAVALDPDVVRGIADGPTVEYASEYARVNSLLDRLAESAAAHLREKGFRAEGRTAATVVIDRTTLSTALPHKTVATLAALGWIGKCALLVTEDYGTAVRLGSVLTYAPLPPDEPVTESGCGECANCVDVCPASAVNGATWTPGMARGDLYDARACFFAARDASAAIGIEHPICGQCIAACPYTQAYLARG